MTISEKFLRYFGAKPEIEDEEVEAEETSVTKLAEMEVEAVLEELSVVHANDDSYTTEVSNLKTLSESFEKIARAEAEIKKAELEAIQAKEKRRVDWMVIVPKVAGVVIYGAVTAMFIAIEREHPPAMRIVQAANTLLNPKI